MRKLLFAVLGTVVVVGLLVALKAGKEGLIMDKDTDIKKALTPREYDVMRNNGTEPPFLNRYWNNKEPGIYVDPLSGVPLFSSRDKFDSGTGWPSFTRPIDPNVIAEKQDTSHGTVRTEVRSKTSDSHLGHVFQDGPEPTGARYCINSASLRFIPVQDLAKEGYAQYASMFEASAKKTQTETATFGAGCFWGVQAAFEGVKGVKATSAGYMGGTRKNPTYKDVCTNTTGHAEVVRLEYDPAQVSYEKLLDIFWDIHNPTTPNRQGVDLGSQYRSVIFYYTPAQEKAARLSKERLEKSGTFRSPVVTEIVAAGEFYRAEEYHQDYYKKQGIEPTCHIPLR
ncbi:MAG: bifunctional methionine sulfoxide reductase B/A protein [Candidatus Omnitrophica bacterium]|nr:bifunctional methionine sulfoxide reductase B/A protein [Candidatus Omnitrophota bacterium]